MLTGQNGNLSEVTTCTDAALVSVCTDLHNHKLALATYTLHCPSPVSLIQLCLATPAHIRLARESRNEFAAPAVLSHNTDCTEHTKASNQVVQGGRGAMPHVS